MRIPIVYSLRNIFRRPVRTFMTISGIAAVVFAAILMFSLSRGITTRLNATGEANNILLISAKGINNMFSEIKSYELVGLDSLNEIAKTKSGKALISPEVMHVPYIKLITDSGSIGTNTTISVRGITGRAFNVHRSVNVTSGRAPRNAFEVIIGKNTHYKLGVSKEMLGIGSKLSFENRTWTVVGEFSANGGLFESEVWVGVNDLMTVLNRNSYSFVVAKLKTPQDAQNALVQIKTEGQIKKYFKGWSEFTYYREVTAALEWLNSLVLIMLAVVATAGVLIGVNTMYSVVVNRLNEIALKRVLGFNSVDIVFELLTEALFICLIGAGVGSAFGFILNGLPIATMQGAFFLVVDATVLGVGLGLSILIGLTGTLIPAQKGLKIGIVEAMRNG